MTAPLTTRRRYVTGSPEAVLSIGINASVTTFALSTGTGFPATPFPLILDYLAASGEEVVLVTGLAGATVTACTRGFNGSAAVSHAANAKCVHGIIALDPEETSQHTSSTGAHGTASPIVGTTDAQTITTKTLSSSKALATASDPGWKVQAAASGTADQIKVMDSADAVQLFRVARGGDVLISPNGAALVPLTAKGFTAQTANLIEAQNVGASKLWVANKAGQVIQKPSDVAAPAWKYVPSADTAHTVFDLRVAADSSSQFTIDNSGKVEGSVIYLRGFFTDDVIKYPVDGSKFKVDTDGDITAASLTSVGAVTSNNLPKVAAGLAGKRIHWGGAAGTTDASGFDVITHGAGFTPANIQCIQEPGTIGGGTRQGGVLGITVITATTFTVRFGLGSALAYDIRFVCFE